MRSVRTSSQPRRRPKKKLNPQRRKPPRVREVGTHCEICTSAGDAVKERILALVVEKTGYPKDMLDLDLDLEADLGVDTVKQAEMFAAIREIYSIPRDENRKLRDYPTLAHVIRFVFEKRPDLASNSAGSERRSQTRTTKTTVVAEKPAPAANHLRKSGSPAIPSRNAFSRWW